MVNVLIYANINNLNLNLNNHFSRKKRRNEKKQLSNAVYSIDISRHNRQVG